MSSLLAYGNPQIAYWIPKLKDAKPKEILEGEKINLQEKKSIRFIAYSSSKLKEISLPSLCDRGFQLDIHKSFRLIPISR